MTEYTQLTLFDVNEDMSLEEIAKASNKTIKFLRREIASGKLKRKDQPGVIRVCRSDYLEWINTVSDVKSQKDDFTTGTTTRFCI